MTLLDTVLSDASNLTLEQYLTLHQNTDLSDSLLTDEEVDEFLDIIEPVKG